MKFLYNKPWLMNTKAFFIAERGGSPLFIRQQEKIQTEGFVFRVNTVFCKDRGIRNFFENIRDIYKKNMKNFLSCKYIYDTMRYV